MTRVVLYRVALKARNVHSVGVDLLGISHHCSSVLHYTNVACSHTDSEFFLSAEDMGNSDWRLLICDVAKLLANPRPPYVRIVSVMRVVRDVDNGNRQLKTNHEALRTKQSEFGGK